MEGLASKEFKVPPQPKVPPRQISNSADGSDEELKEWMMEWSDVPTTDDTSSTPDIIKQMAAMLQAHGDKIIQSFEDKLSHHHEKIKLHISTEHKAHIAATKAHAEVTAAAKAEVAGHADTMWNGFEHPPGPHHGPPKVTALSVEQELAQEFDAAEREALSIQAKLLKMVTSTAFEMVMASVILANVVVMLAGLQLKGEHEAYKLGLRGVDDWPNQKVHFENLEAIFNLMYLVELILRIVAMGKSFISEGAVLMRWIDVGVVLAGCMESFVLRPLQVTGMINISVLRLTRVSRIFRVLKFLRASEHFTEMRVILRTLQMAIRGVMWSALLLGTIILGGGILMAQMTEQFFGDASIDLERKEWLFKFFGTATRASYTMFECTFTGSWIRFSRPLIEDVSPAFAAFWIAWILGINFMTMKVIAAVFMKHTFAVASFDQEQVAMDNMKHKEKFAKELMTIFSHADTSGDGAISTAEFEVMLENPKVIEAFAKLDLDLFEVEALFNVLSSDDGDADYEEFLAGAMKMNSSAATIDAVQVMHNQMKMSRDLDVIRRIIESPSGLRRRGSTVQEESSTGQEESGS